MQSSVFESVREVLATLVRRVSPAQIAQHTSIIDDLGFDSLKLIDLTLALEAHLGLREFPMQDWYDAESRRSDARFTVASLVAACEECRDAAESRV